MNDRIQELVKQAGFNPYNYQGGNSDLFEKFAQSIIQECIYTIQMKIPRNGNTPENLRSYEHVKDIRDHFGVE